MQRKTRVGGDSVLLPMGAMMCGMALIHPVIAAEEVTKLDRVEVRDLQESDALNLNENNGYQATSTRLGKSLQDPHDIPQGVTVVTRELMNDQQVSSFKEALRNVSGLTFNAAEGGRAGDNIMLRGFTTYGDTYLDGVRDSAQYNREVFNLEQVEVLRGSGSMLFGRGQAGGVINQVSKTPKLKDASRVTASVGSYDYHQVTGDFNKRLGETTAMRINVMNRGEGSWRRNGDTGAEPDIQRHGIAPSIAFGLGTNHQLTVSHYHVKTNDNPDYGVNFVNKGVDSARIARFYGTHLTFDHSQTDITTLTHLYRFSNATEVRTVLRNSQYQRDMLAAAPNNHGSPNLSATGYSSKSYKNRIFDTNNLALQSDVTHKTTLANMRHELMAGLEYLNEDGAVGSRPAVGSMPTAMIGGTPFPIYAPGDFLLRDAYRGNTYSFFVQDQVEFVKNWKFLVGMRHDELSNRYPSSVSMPKLNYSEQSYRSALSWQPDEVQHYYLAWSDSFSPTADLYQYSSAYPAERSEVWELGGKWLLMDGDLALRAALYRSDKDWERNTDAESASANPIVSRQRGVTGIDLEVAGRITPRWDVFAGVSLMDASVGKVKPGGDVRWQGKRPANVPDYTYNLWTTYKVASDWRLGLGADAKGERYARNIAGAYPADGKSNTAPAYVRWDAMAAYEQKNYAVRLNVINLFDVDWYNDVYMTGGFTVPGPKQTVIVTTELKF